MRIVYAGLPLGALALMRGGHRLGVACVAGADRVGRHRLRVRAAATDTLLLVDPDLGDEDVLRLVASVRPDLFVSFFWPRRIPEPALRLAPRAFGVHPSLLPRHRGADPIFWTLVRGDTETGVTAHTLTDEVDAGSALLQRRLAVPEGVTGGGLWRILLRESLDVLHEVTAAIVSGRAHPEVPQDEAGATDAPMPTETDLELRWDRPADELLRLVRAASPDPGAYSGLGADALTILDATATTRRIEAGHAVLLPEGVCIGTGSTALALCRVRVGSGATVRGDAIARLFPGASDLR